MSTVEIPENVWNLLKVNNKNTRATSLTSFWHLSLTLNRFHKWFFCFHFWLWTSNILVCWNLKHLFSTMVQWTYSKLIMTVREALQQTCPGFPIFSWICSPIITTYGVNTEIYEPSLPRVFCHIHSTYGNIENR